MKHTIARTEVKQVFGRNMKSSKTNRFTGANAAPAAAHLTQKMTHQRAAKAAAVKNMSNKLAINARADNKAIAAMTRTVHRIAS